jgi:TonB-dependent receptor
MSTRSFTKRLLVTAIAVPCFALVMPMAALAQSGNFTISDPDLGTALQTLAEQSGRTISYSASSVAGKAAPHVEHAPTVDAALAILLANSGLVAKTLPNGAIDVAVPDAKVDPLAYGDAIVVKGQRGAATIAQKSNNFISVLTAADIDRAPDTNVAETLGRLPGVNVLFGGGQNTNGVSVDFAARGEANLVALRGLDPEYNINTINGVEVAQGRPYSRGVELNLLPPQGLQKITVSKSFRADQDGDAIGGIVDFATPSAYDFATGLHGTMFVKGSLNSQEAAYGKQNLDYVIGGGLSYRSKDDTFGVYVGAYYDHHKFANTIIDGEYPAAVNGEYGWAQATADGSSAPGIDPAKNLVLEGLDVGATLGDVKRYGGNVALEWRPSNDVSAYLNATFAQNNLQQDTQYLQLYGNNLGYAQNGTTGTYSPVIGNILPRYYFTTEPETSVLGTVSAGVNIHSGQWTFKPNAFLSWGVDDSDHIEVSGRQTEVGSGFPYGASSLFTYSRGIPFATLSASEQAITDNIGDYIQRRAGETSPETSNQTKYGAKFDATYDVGGDVLKSIAFGAKLSSSVRNHTYVDYTTAKVFNTTTGVGPTLSQSGLISGQLPQLAPGLYSFPAPIFSETALYNSFNNAVASGQSLDSIIDTCSNLVINNQNCDTQHGTETVYAVYALANLKIADIELTPGARFEHTTIKNTFWTTPTDNNGNELPGYFANDSSHFNKFLPSIQVNYRPNAFSVYRASISTSYVRPSLFQLGAGEQISISDSGTSETRTHGNPNLHAIDAVNYDVSGEWTNNQFASASLGAFYKSFTNFTYSQVNNYTNPQGTTGTQNGISITDITPTNGGNGYVEGLEAAGRIQFKMMPKPFDGFGLGGNVTLEHSSVHLSATSSATERLLNQPDFTANALLFYYTGPFSADVTLVHTGAYVAQYNDIGTLDKWVQANNKVDLHLGYKTPFGAKVDFGVANLLNTASYHVTVGRYVDTIPTYVFSGRTFSLTLKYDY